MEVELKLEYRHADRDQLLNQLALIAGAEKTLDLVTTYFDTPERDIARAGYSLRVRRESQCFVQTAKSLATA